MKWCDSPTSNRNILITTLVKRSFWYKKILKNENPDEKTDGEMDEQMILYIMDIDS